MTFGKALAMYPPQSSKLTVILLGVTHGREKHRFCIVTYRRVNTHPGRVRAGSDLWRPSVTVVSPTRAPPLRVRPHRGRGRRREGTVFGAFRRRENGAPRGGCGGAGPRRDVERAEPEAAPPAAVLQGGWRSTEQSSGGVGGDDRGRADPPPVGEPTGPTGRMEGPVNVAARGGSRGECPAEGRGPHGLCPHQL